MKRSKISAWRIEGGSTPTFAGLDPRMAARACYKLIFELTGKEDQDASDYELYLHYRLSPEEWLLLEQVIYRVKVISDGRFNYYDLDSDGENTWQVARDCREYVYSFSKLIATLLDHSIETQRNLNQLSYRRTGIPEYYIYILCRHLSNWLEQQGKPLRNELELFHRKFKQVLSEDQIDANIKFLTIYEVWLAELGTDTTRFPGEYQSFCDCYDQLVTLIHDAHSLDYLQKATDCTYALPDALKESERITSNEKPEEAQKFLARLNERDANGRSIYPPCDYSLSKYFAPYSKLRRGILEACKYLKTNIEDQFRFRHALDPKSYLESLEAFLPLREPDKKTKAASYNAFIRQLVHEWDKLEQNSSDRLIKQFQYLMKTVRNWAAHDRLFIELIEKDIAFLFIINMRCMFQLTDNPSIHETHLLELFEDNALPANQFYLKLEHTNIIELLDNITNEAKERAQRYNQNQPIKIHGSFRDARFFDEYLKSYQKNTVCENYPIERNAILIQGLYQDAWFKLKNAGFSTYIKKPYVREIYRHIYSTSFPNARRATHPY